MSKIIKKDNKFDNRNNKLSKKKYKNDRKERKTLKNGLIKHPKFDEIFIVKNKEELLLTKNMTPGFSVYNEKRLTFNINNEKIEFRQWNPFRSKLAAGIICGLDNIYMKKGTSVLYLGAANGTTLSHVSEIVGIDTLVYAVEFSPRSGRDLINLASKRQNIVPIIADARLPSTYRILVPMVDTIFSDVSQSDQSRIVMENAKYFLKENGNILISIKASCIDSSSPAEKVFADEVNWLRKNEFKPKEQVLLEPYEKNHALLVGFYRPNHKNK